MRTTVVNKHREAFDVDITRPSIWGNPYSHLPRTRARYRVATKEEAVQKFEEYVRGWPELVAVARRHLQGKRLGCVCTKPPCHGDVWVKILEEK